MLETVIAALTALGVGGIVGGWLAARRERAEIFRRHMVEACIAFLETAAKAGAGLSEVQTQVEDYMTTPGDKAPVGLTERRDRLNAATDSIQALNTQLLVLQLFFPGGRGSRLGQHELEQGRRGRRGKGIVLTRDHSSNEPIAFRSLAAAAAYSAGEIVRLYWEAHALLTEGLMAEVGLEELRGRAGRGAFQTAMWHEEFCQAANSAIRGRAF
jgi:hypothetical protein